MEVFDLTLQRRLGCEDLPSFLRDLRQIREGLLYDFDLDHGRLMADQGVKQQLNLILSAA